MSKLWNGRVPTVFLLMPCCTGGDVISIELFSNEFVRMSLFKVVFWLQTRLHQFEEKHNLSKDTGVSKEQFERCLTMHLGKKVTRVKLFGTLSFSEYHCCCGQIACEQYAQTTSEELFQELDADKSGSVTTYELMEW